MKRRFRLCAAVILGASFATAVVVGGVYASGGRFNISKSLSLGLYWISNDPVQKGSYVMFCPPQNSVFSAAKDRGYIGAGFCPGNFGPLMKKVLAAKGDQVVITAGGVTVNGELLPFSKPLSADGLGRPLPQLLGETFTLGDDDLLLMSDRSATSFDARYFGLIHRNQITSTIRPGFTWQGE